jgi:hypothetical protein
MNFTFSQREGRGARDVTLEMTFAFAIFLRFSLERRIGESSKSKRRTRDLNAARISHGKRKIDFIPFNGG